MAGGGCAFVSRTLLFLLRRNRLFRSLCRFDFAVFPAAAASNPSDIPGFHTSLKLSAEYEAEQRELEEKVKSEQQEVDT